MDRQGFNSRRYITIGLVAVIVIGAIVIITGGGRVPQALGRADWPYLFFALGAAVLALFFQCWNYVIVNRLLGIDTGLVNLSEIGLVSIAFGNVVSTPIGATELTTRAALTVPQGYRFGDVAAASLLNSYFKDLAILVLVPVMTAYELATSSVSTRVLGLLVFIIFISVAVLVLLTLILIDQKIRRFFLKITGNLWHFVARRGAERQLADLDTAAVRVKAIMARRPGTVALLFGLMIGDWVATLTSFGLCFHAVGISVGVPVLVTGFVAGKIAAIASFIPGGIGIRSLSAAGTFALFGLDFHAVILPVVLFRVVYDFIPYLASFVLVRSLLKRVS